MITIVCSVADSTNLLISPLYGQELERIGQLLQTLALASLTIWAGVCAGCFVGLLLRLWYALRLARLVRHHATSLVAGKLSDVA